MIPLKLRLYNFTSYGTNVPELDFTQFHLAAISGSNGAGKSSLIDAITWALWGESRVGGNADKLIRVGSNQMGVEFEFELEEIKYLVRRKRLLKGKGVSSLEFLSNGKNLTEGTIKSTQQKIIDVLHMTYEIFVNSSYLRQGRADEFTLKPPSDRKEILGGILELDNFDRLEEKAKEKARELGARIEALSFQIKEIESELETKEERFVALTQIEKELQEVGEKEEKAEKTLKELQAQKELLAARVSALQKTQQRIESLKEELSSLKKQYQEKQLTVQDFQTILAQEAFIQKNDLLLKELREKSKGLQKKQTELNSLQENLRILYSQESALSSHIARLETALKESERRGRELKQRCEDLEKSICPTCKQPIHNKEENASLKEESQKLHSEERGVYLKVKTSLVSSLKQSEILAKKVEEATQKIKALSQDLAEYASLEKKIDSLAENEVKKIRLSEAKGRIEAESKALSDLENLIKTRELALSQESKELSEFEKISRELVSSINQYKESELILSEIREKVRSKRTELGAAQKLVDRTIQLEDLRKTKSKDIAGIRAEKNDYEELSLAFGKKGIQASIIETVIPEIEQEANILLDKLSEGRMRVSLTTQREAKTGGTIETLDILISDEEGERSYETYSGGECYRVNIALRLALSKLLTRRSGAKLQFLVIDEGFGTQDASGRDRVIEAINLIQDSFAKILVITHIEELKEVFPARIEVTKNIEGSTFQVVS